MTDHKITGCCTDCDELLAEVIDRFPEGHPYTVIRRGIR